MSGPYRGWKPEGRRRFLRAIGIVALGLVALWLASAAILLFISRPRAAEAQSLPVRQLWVIDGDTLDLLAPHHERIRLEGIDAPETARPSCEAERQKSLEAKRAAIALVRAGRTATVTRKGQDRFGRTLADVSIDGRDLGRHLLERRLALPYRPGPDAKARRIAHWCGPGPW